MKTVSNITELLNNISVIDRYLKSADKNEIDYAKGLIKRGTCFVAIKSDEGYKFYPSRFIGYSDNTMDAHERNYEKDGKETNPAISAVIGSNPQHNDALEDEYKEYCVSLGFKANKAGSFGVKRKYWMLKNK